MKKEISVIIPTYNSWKTLKSCLTSLFQQSYKPFELIVIDNASSDDSPKLVKKYFQKVRLVQMKTNTGVTGGRNAGINIVNKNTDYIFFFDHDMVADKKMLDELVKVIKSDENIGIVTPKIYYWEDPPDGRQGKKRIWAAGTSINLWTGQVLFRGGEDRGQFDDIEEVQVAPAAMLVKKEVINKIKGFDDRYFATYEDTDFCFRARKAGFKTYYAPKAVAHHKLPTDPKEEAIRLLSRAYWIGRNRILFMKDFGKNFLVFIFFIPLFSLYYLKLALQYNKIKYWFLYIKGIIAGISSS